MFTLEKCRPSQGKQAKLHAPLSSRNIILPDIKHRIQSIGVAPHTGKMQPSSVILHCIRLPLGGGRRWVSGGWCQLPLTHLHIQLHERIIPSPTTIVWTMRDRQETLATCDWHGHKRWELLQVVFLLRRRLPRIRSPALDSHQVPVVGERLDHNAALPEEHPLLPSFYVFNALSLSGAGQKYWSLLANTTHGTTTAFRSLPNSP